MIDELPRQTDGGRFHLAVISATIWPMIEISGVA
jgi:hypothetical protein